MHYGQYVISSKSANVRAGQYLIDAFEYAFPEEIIHLLS